MRPHIVEECMTPTPITIGREQPLAAAHALMREHQIRHLPVLHGGALVGIVSDRDLHLVETLRDVDPDEVAVEEAMSADPYAVAPDAALGPVVAEMARRKLGAAIVVRGARVVGILTAIDVMGALAAALDRVAPP